MKEGVTLITEKLKRAEISKIKQFRPERVTGKTINEDSRRHIIKEHGKNEELRRQKNIVETDFEELRNILENYDSFTYAGREKKKNGKKGVHKFKYEKIVGKWRYTVIVAFEHRNKFLAVKTFHAKLI